VGETLCASETLGRPQCPREDMFAMSLRVKKKRNRPWCEFVQESVGIPECFAGSRLSDVRDCDIERICAQ